MNKVDKLIKEYFKIETAIIKELNKKCKNKPTTCVCEESDEFYIIENDTVLKRCTTCGNYINW